MQGQPYQQYQMYPLPAAAVRQAQYMNSNATEQAQFPIRVKCPFCGFIGDTTVTKHAGGAVWGWCLVMACFTGCCCIPFCVDSCQDKKHSCSSCAAHLGTYVASMC